MLLSILSNLVLAWVMRVSLVSLCMPVLKSYRIKGCPILLLNGQHHADLLNTTGCKFFSNSEDLDFLVQVCFKLGLELNSAGQ